MRLVMFVSHLATEVQPIERLSLLCTDDFAVNFADAKGPLSITGSSVITT